MTQKMSWPQAIEKVLRESPVPLHYTDIAEKIIQDGLRSELVATPSMTVSARITSSINDDGGKSPFVRVERGIYTLRAKFGADGTVEPVASEIEEEEQYDIVSSFGMFWRRDAVDRRKSRRKIKITGRRQGGTPVDFTEQTGVYLLHLGGQVIYVGRTARGLGERLREHTKPTSATGRLAPRWDRFSWFGLRLVNEDGSLGDLPGNLGADKLLPVLEAILIEALEPRQNRQKGEGLEAVEYIQDDGENAKGA